MWLWPRGAPLLLALCLRGACPKYMEGELRTSQDWAFLARFCFLSEQGTFEYYFQFNADQGFPNLLLYYDAENQWPAVYNSDKNCRQRESVLSIEQNQIVNLSLQYPYNDLAGCSYRIIGADQTTAAPVTTSRPTRARTYTVNVDGITRGTKPMTKRTTTTTTMATTTEMEIENSTDSFLTEYIDLDEQLYNTTETHLEYEDVINETQTEPSREKRAVLPDVSPGTEDWRNVLVTCRNARRFRSARERWWFVAISNCDGRKGIDISYQILMTNGPPGDYWHEHFSADEFYILPVLMAFSTAYGMLLFAIVMCSVELKSRQLLHSTYKLFVLSALSQFIGIALQTVSYLKYAVVGIMPTKVKTIGGVFIGCSETVFLLVLLLLAKGYTTTRGRLPLPATVKLTVFMCLYAVTYITLFIYESKVFDPGQVLYLYESPAGYGLIVLRVIAWWMFIYSTVFTLKHYPEKSNFYYPFNICGTLWFVAGPAFILSANSYIDKWVRESVVCGVLLFISFAGHLMFLVLTLPAMANKNFPYHIRTTQIGVMQTETIENFNHHAYEPTTRPGDVQTVIIPLRPQENEEWAISDRLEREMSPVPRESVSPTSSPERHPPDMENVLNWSAARGPIAPPPEREQATLSPSTVFRQAALDNGHLNEWTRDVPVELFTISKLVVDKKTT